MADHNSNAPPTEATNAVLVQSEEMPHDAQQVEELDFNKLKGPITAEDLFLGMRNMGFQASSMAEAIRIINDMGVFRWLVEHKHVSAIVTTAGGVEEDFIKCLGNTYMSSFSADGADLRKRGLNRIGNLVVPNANYCAFEDWIVPIFDKMLEEQEASKGTEDEIHWTPSKIIHRLGKEINDERSVYYWAYKNDIPVFCPALTDGSLGDMLYFHTFKTSPLQLRVDIVEDIRRINTIAVRAKRAGMIILGGGIVKHHIANACLMRNGAESAVYINTAQEFDGSDAGARPDEAVSWGKIKIGADSVKVYLEATACFPFIVANTFAKDI
ncbi:Deoxyhypusine synthase [Cladobotryum mycophilum]|uniref:deoxyhypusine synthase n=1 Tax=Cladobotryum mycophilum TaxID=491253 RepID=A0ABR0SXT9_9HYPO